MVAPFTRGRHLVLGMVLAGAMAGGSLGAGCQHRTESDASARDASARGLAPTHVSWNAEFAMSEKGRPRAVLRARRMEQYEDGDSTYSVWRSMSDSARVRVVLFNEEGDSSATVRADSLVFQDQKGILDAYRDVVVTTDDNKRLKSEKLTWHQADRTIRTRRFVRIRTPSEVVQGDGLVADETLDTYQLGRFSAEVEVENEDDNGDAQP